MSTRVRRAASPITPRSAGVSHTAQRRPELPLDEGQPVVELQPRVVGPGRRERAYQARQAALEAQLRVERDAAGVAQRELDLAQLVERGSSRRQDKLEDQLERERSQQKRLLLAMGAMQQELSALRARSARLSAASAPRRRPLLARLFGAKS